MYVVVVFPAAFAYRVCIFLRFVLWHGHFQVQKWKLHMLRPCMLEIPPLRSALAAQILEGYEDGLSSPNY